MNDVDLSLELLKSFASDPNFQKLSYDEKIDQAFKAYKKIYRSVSKGQEGGNPGGGESGGPKPRRDIAAAILQIVSIGTDTNLENSDFTGKTDKLLEKFKHISTKLAEIEL